MAVRLMLVDDSPQFLDLAARLLAAQGMTIAARASCGDEALRLAVACRPDVALVDVELGEEDGIVLAGRLASSGDVGNVILISIRDRSELAELTSDTGIAGFLRKDVLDARAITEIIRQPLAGT
jgi:two-component system nitrate/nitrite response regulator NarL